MAETKLQESGEKPLKLSAVILIGGPTMATQFRPISLDVPKPLFPIAGKPMIWHIIAALKKVKGMEVVYLIGSFANNVIEPFANDASKEFDLNIKYLKEESSLGTAGGLFKFKDEIVGERDYIFMLHSDICCEFPLQELLDFHKSQKDSYATMMGTKVDKGAAQSYGCFVADETTHKMLHYIERPETFLSDTINAGIYVFSPLALQKPLPRSTSKKDLNEMISFPITPPNPGYMSLERELIPSLVNEQKFSVYFYNGFWRSVKSAGGAVYANEQLILAYSKKDPSKLTKASDIKCDIVGGVMIDPSAKVDPSAKIGPNVTIGPNAIIGKGVRVSNSIILQNVQVKENACIVYSIVGEDSIIGQWTRLEGIRSATAATFEGADARFRRTGITVFGKGVTANPEIIVRNCIVMPHKALSRSVFDEIIL